MEGMDGCMNVIFRLVRRLSADIFQNHVLAELMVLLVLIIYGDALLRGG